LGALLVFGAYPFLAITRRAQTDWLIVEGWVHPHAIKAAVEEFRAGHYRQALSTGGPVEGTGPYRNDYNTSAHVGYTRLLQEGLATNQANYVVCKVRDRDRTYSSALALREWFAARGQQPESINVLTETVHSRRSRLLFQKAFGPSVQVGVISVLPDDYPPGHWWKYSAGVKDVFSEGIAYLYVRLFFWP